MEYTSMAREVVKLALGRGATAVECTVAEGDEFAVQVRLGEVEKLKEAGSRGAGLRVLIGKRSGSAHTSDLSAEGLRAMVKAAVENCSVTTEDPFAGLPEEEELGRQDVDLEMSSDDVKDLTTEARIGMAKLAEKTALDLDPRIVNSEGASFDAYAGGKWFANSLGFEGGYRSTTCSLSVVPVAKEGEKMERDYWYTVSRRAAGLESPEQVGRMAAGRALRRLGARKVDTQKAPVIFENNVARGLLAELFEAVSGDTVWREASYLAGELGNKIAAPFVQVVDDGTLPGLLGSSPFDDEGVKTRRTVVVEDGVLKSYLLNTYTAKKLGMKTTGNASRGLSGASGVGLNNLFLVPGRNSLEEMCRKMGRGLLVTELMGQGVNIVNGDYSRGAAGLWIEGGEVTGAVSEITIANNLKRMWLEMVEAGSDIDYRGSIACPSLWLAEMTISGN